MPKTSILLLEDDIFHRSLLAEGLEDYYDFEVARAETVEAADERLKGWAPDLFVLDCVLGDDSFRVLEWVKRMRRRTDLSDVPILFVTAFYREMEEQVRAVPRSAILAKPFTFEDVTQKIRGLLGVVAGKR